MDAMGRDFKIFQLGNRDPAHPWILLPDKGNGFSVRQG
jgi:hypothetical protein